MTTCVEIMKKSLRSWGLAREDTQRSKAENGFKKKTEKARN